MGKYNYEEIRFIKHLWILNYSDLGMAKPISKLLSKNYLIFLLGFFIWLPIMQEVFGNILISLIPFFVIGLLFFLIIVDGVYSSFKVIKVLEICHKYIDPNMTLENLISVINNCD